MKTEDIIKAIEEEAASCRESSEGNGEYNAAFWACHLVLESLAKKLRAIAEAAPAE